MCSIYLFVLWVQYKKTASASNENRAAIKNNEGLNNGGYSFTNFRVMLAPELSLMRTRYMPLFKSAVGMLMVVLPPALIFLEMSVLPDISKISAFRLLRLSPMVRLTWSLAGTGNMRTGKFN